MVGSPYRTRNLTLLGVASLLAFMSSCRPGTVPPTLVPPWPTPSLSTSPTTVLPTFTPAPTVIPSPTTAIAPTGQVSLSRETVVDGARALAWSPDGTRIAVTTLSGVVLLDATTLEEMASATTSVPQDALSFSRDEATLATADYGMDRKQFRLWNTDDLSVASAKKLPGRTDDFDLVMLIAFTQDGDLLLVTSGLTGTDVWRVAPDGGMRRALQIEAVIPESATVDPSRGLIATYMSPGGPEQNVQIRSFLGANLQQELPYTGALELEFAPGEGALLISTGDAVIVWDVDRSRELTQIPISTGRLAVGRNDALFAAGTDRPALGTGLWEVRTGTLVGFIPDERLNDTVQRVFSPTNDELGMLRNDGALEIWEFTR